jgi:hypothetical protein
MKSRWETHKGIRIFYFDISNFGSDDAGIIEEVDVADAVIMSEPENTVLILNDVRNSIGSIPVIKHLQLSANRSSPYIQRAAVIGVSGSKLILLEAINRFSKVPIMPFDDVEKAMDWLIRDKTIQIPRR